jgi:D-hydroxyproline dehydrogenase subunit gamma
VTTRGRRGRAAAEDRPASVRIVCDDSALVVPADATLAAALLGAGVTAFRHSSTGEPRGPLCGMGTCFECRVRVDGTPHVRACVEPVRDGMQVATCD